MNNEKAGANFASPRSKTGSLFITGRRVTV